MFASKFLQEELCASSWNLPAGQISQTVFAPSAGLNLPLAQSKHAAPVLAWYFPALQNVLLLVLELTSNSGRAGDFLACGSAVLALLAFQAGGTAGVVVLARLTAGALADRRVQSTTSNASSQVLAVRAGRACNLPVVGLILASTAQLA